MPMKDLSQVDMTVIAEEWKNKLHNKKPQEPLAKEIPSLLPKPFRKISASESEFNTNV